MTGCDLCDVHDHPRLPDPLLVDSARDLHRAMHQFGRILADPLVPIVDRISRALTRT